MTSKKDFWKLRSNNREGRLLPSPGDGAYLPKRATSLRGSGPHSGVIILNDFPIGQDPHHPPGSLLGGTCNSRPGWGLMEETNGQRSLFPTNLELLVIRD